VPTIALDELLRDPKTLLLLEPEELAVYLLERFQHSSSETAQSLYNFIIGVRQSHAVSPAVEEAFTEAWWWLIREGFVIEKVSSQQGWYYISKRGKRALESNDPLVACNGRSGSDPTTGISVAPFDRFSVEVV
jgi:hypothetical protein